MQYVLCIHNKEYPASLERFKVYRVLPDERASANNFLRIIDESGQDYLYPCSCFASIELPQEAMIALAAQP